MTTLIFSHWEAVELFCRIVSKFEDFSLSDFSNIKTLNSYLQKAKHVDYCTMVTIRMNKNATKADAVAQNAFYTLSYCIRNKHMYTPHVHTLASFERFIDDRNYKPRVSTTREWIPSPKKMNYEGKSWSTYHHDKTKIIQEDGSTKTISAIGRGLLTFKPFSKVEILSYNVRTDLRERYIGEFHFYSEARYLLLDLKTDDSEEKNLRMEFFIGSNNVVSLALGQYHNIDDDIYSGTVIIVQEKGEITTNQIKLYNYDDPNDRSEIDNEYIWNYFADEGLNNLRVPTGINNLKLFSTWVSENRS